MPPDEEVHVPVRLIQESSKILVAPIPFDLQRNSFAFLLLQRVDVACAPSGLFCAEDQVEGTSLVLCAARPIHRQIVLVSIHSPIRFLIYLKSPRLPD